MTPPDAMPVHITGWDRGAIVALGGAGCALSYDALQQMAVAIHIRGLLTYLFPLVIDGFIGYGVRAVLVMRSASLGSRCYVWALFGIATAASIWANALHAVRLNNRPSEGGLRLGDVTVGVLSTLAPLALAGAVHLYILIARRAAAQPGGPNIAVTSRAPHERVTAEALDTQDGAEAAPPVTGHRSSALTAGDTNRPVDARHDLPIGESATAAKTEPVTVSGPGPEQERRDADPSEEPDARRGDRALTQRLEPNQPAFDAAADTPLSEPDAKGKPLAGDADELLPIARRAVTDTGKLTRKVVADAIRGQGLPLSNDRLTDLMQQLRAEAGARTLRPTG